MDVEKLTQSQLIMLAAFVSFMTSISTGIVTVALMQQAPPAITQNVSRVVERTVERVVSGQPAAAAAPQVKTVVVKESASLSASIDAILPSTVRLYTNAESPVFLAVGFVVNSDGTIATDGTALKEISYVTVDTQTGLRLPFAVTGVNSAGVAFLKPATSTNTIWQPALIAQDRALLGASVVSVSGKSSMKIYPGVVVAFSSNSSAQQAGLVETNIDTAAIMPGSPLVDASGAVVGMQTNDSQKAGPGNFLTSENILVPLKESHADADATMKESTSSSSIIR